MVLGHELIKGINLTNANLFWKVYLCFWGWAENKLQDRSTNKRIPSPSLTASDLVWGRAHLESGGLLKLGCVSASAILDDHAQIACSWTRHYCPFSYMIESHICLNSFANALLFVYKFFKTHVILLISSEFGTISCNSQGTDGSELREWFCYLRN